MWIEKKQVYRLQFKQYVANKLIYTNNHYMDRINCKTPTSNHELISGKTNSNYRTISSIIHCTAEVQWRDWLAS